MRMIEYSTQKLIQSQLMNAAVIAEIQAAKQANRKIQGWLYLGAVSHSQVQHPPHLHRRLKYLRCVEHALRPAAARSRRGRHFLLA